MPPNDAAYLAVFGARDYSPNEAFGASISYGNNGTAPGEPEAVRKKTLIYLGKHQKEAFLSA